MPPPTDRTKLLLLGSIEVRGAGIDDDVARLQPKRVALLAYLAMNDGPVRRDTLFALFWPELDAQAARRALNQAAFHLRKSLGEDALVSDGSDALALNRARVLCDAAEFETLCRDGERERAIRLYRGPFALGFHIGGLLELDRWIDATRLRLKTRALEACLALGNRAAEHDGRAALEWARKAYDIEPGDESAQRLMLMHDALGDRTGAIRAYEQFARDIAHELDVEPAPETQRLADDIRSRAEPLPDVAPFTPLRMAASPVPADAALPSRSPRWRAKPALLVAGVLAVGFIGTIASVAMSRGNRGPDAGTFTKSPAALEAYRAGERDLDSGRFESAVEHFRQAVMRDSSYAMGHYRLSVAANWTGQSSLSMAAAAHAQQLATSLPPRDRSRIDAWMAYFHGEIDVAARLYTGMLAADPNDFDATFYLAEIEFHWGSSFGKPAAASEEMWDRVLRLQPSNAGAIIHCLRIAAMERDSTTFESLASRLAKLNPSADHQIEVRVLRAFTFGDSAARAQASAEVVSVDALRRTLVHEALVSAADLSDAARRLLPAMFAGQGFTGYEQGEFLLGARVHAATGNLAAALAVADSAAALQPDRALEYRAMLVAIPELGASAQLRAAVERQLESPLSSRTMYASAQALREYLGAILAVRGGRLDIAREKLARLRAVAAPPSGPDAAAVPRHVDRLSRIVGAEIARAEGRAQQALDLLGAPTPEPDRRMPYVWSYPKAEERLLRGDLLVEVGRLNDARAWYETFPDPSAYDLAYLGVALQRRLTLATRMNDARSASRIKARLASLRH